MRMRDLTDLTKEDLLDALGLAVKPSKLGIAGRLLGPFGTGLLIGAAAALLLAPKPGRELRRDIRDYLPRVKGHVEDAISEATSAS